MYLHSRHCRLFEYTITTQNPCAVSLTPDAIGTTTTFFDCLAVTISMQPGDKTTIAAAVHAIRELCTHPSAIQIVIEGLTSSGAGPARHSFDVLVQLADALDVLDELVEQLRGYGERVHLIPYGWNTETYSYISGEPGSQHILTIVANAQAGTRTTRRSQDAS
ncbi:hypothetical protein [Nocardia sp. NRRL WC-3656]|uniref:hypothetical protein n=1 Tax=Nocardia sp. NRRL WC-3656 TaxID=1463824 RepID=UPI0004C2D771|nr:hypothetical protein [Nocardia sp. NRRL WC-3656]